MPDDIALLEESFEAIARKYGVAFIQVSITRADTTNYWCAMHFESRTTTYMSGGASLRLAIEGAYENMVKDDYGDK